jgi:polysaccharide export outer membrane protein
MISAPRRGLCLLACAWVGLALGGGCSGLGARHHAKKIPQLGVIEPCQPRELQMVSMPPYVVEPPDELEVSVRPAYPDLTTTTLPVQMDGNIDLGFVGDVYVAGLTLEQIETKVAQQLNTLAGRQAPKGGYQVSVRLVNGSQSKSFYVLGAVTTQGKFPITGNETVLDGILQAGLRTNSMPEKAYVVRPHPAGGPDQIMAVDWFGIRDRGDSLTNYQLFPGDRIIVPGGKPPGLISTLVGG